MRQVKTFCDKCGILIAAHRSELVARVGPLKAAIPGTLDMCGECAGELLAFIGEPTYQIPPEAAAATVASNGDSGDGRPRRGRPANTGRVKTA